MLFGNEKRFGKTLVTSGVDSQVMGVKSDATDSSLGPGSYYNNFSEERRGGWANKSFSKRSPMTPSKGHRQSTQSLSGVSLDSRDLYQSAVMTSFGAIAMPPSPKHNGLVPGPGYYDPDLLTTFGSPKHISSKSGSPSSRTPRFAFSNSAVMKDGVLFQSAENERKEIGPGYYSVEKDLFNKPSFNVRASKGKNFSSPNSAATSRARTPNRMMSRDNSAGNLQSSGSTSGSPYTPRGQYTSPAARPRSAVSKHREEYGYGH